MNNNKSYLFPISSQGLSAVQSSIEFISNLLTHPEIPGQRSMKFGNADISHLTGVLNELLIIRENGKKASNPCNCPECGRVLANPTLICICGYNW